MTNILQKNYVLIFNILLSFSTQCTENFQQLYTTSFLKNNKAVHACLIQHGFSEITFKTPDNLTLHGLFLSRPHATSNVIICAGWFPGKKEGMATFYDLLPTDCNILFFDARGHGSSEGLLLWKLWEYGIHEYKDILGAISYLNNVNTLPIVIIGICSGAFNAAHALVDLEKNNKTESSHVKGLVFDSGWGSVTEIARTAPPAGIEKRLINLLKKIYTNKKQIKEGYIFKLCSLITRINYSISYHMCTKHVTAYYEKITTLFDKINHITIPILFIHSCDDTYAIKSDAIRLSQLAPHTTSWWIKKSFHAKHHLIHKKLYKQRLRSFLNYALPPSHDDQLIQNDSLIK
jgi:pimeloyl-ACP methyl ester carboxylesterase